MKNPKLRSIIENLNLSKDDKAELKRILQRPEVEAIIDGDSQEQLAHRQQLADELAAIPGQIKAAEKSFESDLKRISARFYKAEKEFKEAQAEYRLIAQRSSYAGYTHQIRASEIEMELCKTADIRINDFGVELSKLEGAVLEAFEIWLANVGYDGFNRLITVQKSNGNLIDAATAAIRKARDQLKTMRLTALSHTQVTESLSEMSLQLKKPLAALNLTPPRINSEGEVKHPLPFGVHETADEL